MNKKLQVLLIMFGTLCLTGCFWPSGTDTEDSRYHAYYLNKEKTKIVEEEYDPKGSGQRELIEEFLSLIHEDADSVEYRKPLLNGAEIMNYAYDGDQISLYFNEAYAQAPPAEEVLCRAAIVRTLTQIPRVTCVSFYIGDAPLTDANGDVVGLMTNESFVENPGEQINAVQTANIRLYFSNTKGNGLLAADEEVQYITNISLEKLVMEHLLEGPKKKGMVSAIPKGTKLVSVSTTNGVCYVNLDEGFLNQEYEIQEPIVIYSIVDSLSELPTVNKVQISVNGNTSGVYRDSYALDTVYERNLDYVITETDSSELEGSELTFE